MFKRNFFVKSLGVVALISTFVFGVKAQTPIAHYSFSNTLAASVGSFGNAVIGTAGSATIGLNSVCTDNTNNYSSGLKTPSISSLNTTNFQIDFTVNLSSLPTHASAPLFIVGSGRYFGLLLNQTGQLKVYYNNGNESAAASGITLSPGTNYNIQIQYNTGLTILKVNNQVYLTVSLPTLVPVVSNRDIYIGDNPGAPQANAAVEGCYSNFKVYNNPMSFTPIYVNSSTGDDINGTGTQANPVKSFHKAYQILPVGGGTINLTGTFDWTNTDETGDLTLTGYTLAKNLEIIGQGADQTIIQAHPTANTTERRIFTINSGFTVTIEKVNLRNGRVSNLSNSVNPADGGAIYNNGTLTLNFCRFSQNYAVAGSFSGGAGGAILHNANNTLTINSCTFDNNQAENGGALANNFNNASGRFVITNSTFAFNKQLNSTGTVGGGAIWILNGTNIITNCTFNSNELTFVANTAGGTGSSILVRQGSIRLKNNIFVNGLQNGIAISGSRSEIEDAGGSATDDGNNIFGKQSASFLNISNTSYFDSKTTGATDGIFTLNNSSPSQNCNLSISNTLALNGATNGILTLETSGVSQDNGSIVANNGIAIPNVDQRGVARTNLTDIGSFESNVTSPLLTLSTSSISSFATCTSEESFTVSGTNLFGDIFINAPTGYQVSLTSGSGFASALTLSPSNGVVNTTTIYAKINSASAGAANISVSTVCSGTQNISVIGTVNSTFTWTGATSTSPTVAGNWNPASVPCDGANKIIPAGLTNYPTYTTLNILSGSSFTLQSGARMTVTGLITNNGTLTVENGATLLFTSGLAGSGSYTVKQAISDCANDGSAPTGRFWYMGIPLSSMSRSNAFGNAGTMNRLWQWSEGAQTWSSQITDNTTLSAANGYVLRLGSNTTLNFTGTNLYNANATWTGLQNNNGTFGGCHLFANSNTAYLDWHTVYGTGVSSTYCVRSYNTTNNQMVYDTYNAVGTVAVQNSSYAVTRYIAPMQAFWIRVNPSTTGIISIQKTGLSHQPTATGLKEITEFPAFARLNIVDDAFSDQVVIYTDAEANSEVEDHDSKKFFLPNVAQVYCKVGNEKLVINALKKGKAHTSAPLTIELPSSKVYKFEMAESFVENGLVILEDRQEGVFQDMGVNPTYEFYSNSGVFDDRFVLHFQLPNGVSNEGQADVENLSTAQIDVISNQNGEILVSLSADLAATGEVQILDAAGRLIQTSSIKGQNTKLQITEGTGIYFVRVCTPMKSETKKVLVY